MATVVVVQGSCLEEDTCQSGPRGWSQSGSRGLGNPMDPVKLVLPCSGPAYMTKGMTHWPPLQSLGWIVINSFLVNVLKKPE